MTYVEAMTVFYITLGIIGIAGIIYSRYSTSPKTSKKEKSENCLFIWVINKN